jgi:hypothetical protein
MDAFDPDEEKENDSFSTNSKSAQLETSSGVTTSSSSFNPARTHYIGAQFGGQAELEASYALVTQRTEKVDANAAHDHHWSWDRIRDFCVRTIRHSDKLDEEYRRGQTGKELHKLVAAAGVKNVGLLLKCVEFASRIFTGDRLVKMSAQVKHQHGIDKQRPGFCEARLQLRIDQPVGQQQGECEGKQARAVVKKT